jgi:hypothetical protein
MGLLKKKKVREWCPGSNHVIGNYGRFRCPVCDQLFYLEVSTAIPEHKAFIRKSRRNSLPTNQGQEGE